MTFKRLFNWLKLKMLPSSVLFKNRLFIERDSKHRRVMSNFGLTFRNSKWTNYSLLNVSVRSINSFLKLLTSIFVILVFIILIQSQLNMYSLDMSYNVIMYYFWSVKIQTSYVIFISFWGIHYVFNNLFSFIFYSFFNNFFKNALKNNDTQPLLDSVESVANNDNLSSLAKINKNNIDNVSTKSLDDVENVFENQNEQNVNTVLLLKYLYKSSYLISLSRNNYVNFSVFSRKPSIFNKNENTIKTNFTKPEYKWTLDGISSRSPLQKEGLFYVTDLNYNTLNNEIQYSNELKNQINMVGIQRFMFKYNPLHRSIMKGSINLTNTKKLLAPYNMSSSLSLKKTNLWLSQKNKHYDNFNKNSVIRVSDSIENSYFFTLKRFYMFNKLSANLVTSKFIFKENQTDLNLNSSFKGYENLSIFYDNLLNILINHSSLNKLDILNINNKITTFYLKNDQNSLFNKFDIILSLEDNNLFNNNNDLLLNYLDNINSFNTMLNVFNVYNSDEFYINMMYDFSDSFTNKETI